MTEVEIQRFIWVPERDLGHLIAPVILSGTTSVGTGVGKLCSPDGRSLKSPSSPSAPFT